MSTFERAILKQDTVVSISGTSQIAGGKTGDLVNIDTVVHLTNPEPQEITLVLPSISGDPQKAYIRTMDEVENRQDFSSPIDPELLSSMREEDRKAFEESIAANKAQWEAIKEKANGVALTKMQLEAGSQELKFFLQKEISPNPESGLYELTFVAPFSNFQVNQGQFTMSLIIILPRDAQLVEQSVINPQGGPLPELRSNDNHVNRQILQYWMQYDPIFTIKYRY
ncbi:hypothetical protein [Neobacillus sp. OS1-33]|uniref:hypothetical protein n=1 Tax=Neobacillus sp. OS1-33 TaxID=3070683 RepID=UPI0027DFB55D|nr:hypothetical protein [Neobacillus sp. OS1-33]WML27334.1 hypothetical protein RCG22_06860 [Neobacillus sp. OS1-33]